MSNIDSLRSERTFSAEFAPGRGDLYTVNLDSLDLSPQVKCLINIKTRGERIMRIELSLRIWFGSKTKKITIRIEW